MVARVVVLPCEISFLVWIYIEVNGVTAKEEIVISGAIDVSLLPVVMGIELIFVVEVLNDFWPCGAITVEIGDEFDF